MRGRSEPLVSVIVPTYGRPSLLADAVRSVARQTYENVELVVVDDHSPTPANAVLDDVALDGLAAVECLRHDENRGANAARNTGLDAATGDLVAFLDDDDAWLPEKISRQVERFEEASDEVGLVYTGQRFVDETGATTRVRTPTTRGDVTEQLFHGASLGPFSTVMVRSELVRTAGRPDERLPGWQDREWYVRLSRHCRVEPVAEPLVVRRMHADHQISDDFAAKRDVSYPLLLEKHRDLAAEYGPRVERQFVASLSVSLAGAGIQNGHFREVVPYLLRAIRCSPTNVRAYCYLLVAVCGEYLYEAVRLGARRGRRLLGDGHGSRADADYSLTDDDMDERPLAEPDHYLEEAPLVEPEEAE